jgi:hypothetical protein
MRLSSKQKLPATPVPEQAPRRVPYRARKLSGADGLSEGGGLSGPDLHALHIPGLDSGVLHRRAEAPFFSATGAIELTEPTRDVVSAWIALEALKPSDFWFQS